jgi:hypothetical protein
MSTNENLELTAESVRDRVSAAVAKSACQEKQRRAFLDASLSLPTQGTVVVDEFHAQNLAVCPGSHKVWFITMGDPQSVFFVEAGDLFGACWGPGRSDNAYMDLGFRSPDPVEMFQV